MKTGTKLWLITAASLVLIGCILFFGVMTSLRWDFSKLSTVEYETNSYEITDPFHSISINTDTADILFVPSGDGSCRVTCYEEERAAHRVAVKDGTLSIEQIDRRSFGDSIGIHSGSPKVTVYLPKTEYALLSIRQDTGDIVMPNGFQFQSVDISLSTGGVDFRASASGSIRIQTTTGDIHVADLSAAALDLSVSTGKVTVTKVTCEGDLTVGVSTGKTYLTDVSCGNLITSGSTGDLSLRRVTAARAFHIERTTGDVEFDGCDAAEIFVTTDTGDVEGSLRSEKIFFITTGTGDIEVPKTTAGGRCEITTDTGDIEIDIP